ncbi:hypothetical protein KM043_008008 [Ampulex compressa]|nr:hypothetical protein KM043_008008 [Ampulex compressa]
MSRSNGCASSVCAPDTRLERYYRRWVVSGLLGLRKLKDEACRVQSHCVTAQARTPSKRISISSCHGSCSSISWSHVAQMVVQPRSQTQSRVVTLCGGASVEHIHVLGVAWSLILNAFSTIIYHLSLELRSFSGASSTTCAAVVYIRVLRKDAGIREALLSSKSRVVPLRTVSSPCLKFCAASLLARLMQVVAIYFGLNVTLCRAWKDSQVVLAWFICYPFSWTVMVNRVAEIQEWLLASLWRHISGVDNSADNASSCMLAKKLRNHPLWSPILPDESLSMKLLGLTDGASAFFWLRQARQETFSVELSALEDNCFLARGSQLRKLNVELEAGQTGCTPTLHLGAWAHWAFLYITDSPRILASPRDAVQSVTQLGRQPPTLLRRSLIGAPLRPMMHHHELSSCVVAFQAMGIGRRRNLVNQQRKCECLGAWH